MIALQLSLLLLLLLLQQGTTVGGTTAAATTDKGANAAHITASGLFQNKFQNDLLLFEFVLLLILTLILIFYCHYKEQLLE